MNHRYIKRLRARHKHSQGGRCYYCGIVMLEFHEAKGPLKHRRISLDHLRPLKNGGGWTIDNTVAACRTCNNQKGSMSPEEFLSRIMGRIERKEDASLTERFEKGDIPGLEEYDGQYQEWTACVVATVGEASPTVLEKAFLEAQQKRREEARGKAEE